MKTSKLPINELELKLSQAAKLLDDCTAIIRNIPFKSHEEHIESIGKSLINIFSIQGEIYQIEPELMPAYLKVKEPGKQTQAIHAVCFEARSFEMNEEYTQAQDCIEQFIANHPQEPIENLELLKKEIERLKKKQ